MRNEASNRIKDFMGESGFGECDRFRVSWKSATRRTFDNKRFFADHPELDASDYYKETSIRIFRVSEI